MYKNTLVCSASLFTQPPLCNTKSIALSPSLFSSERTAQRIMQGGFDEWYWDASPAWQDWLRLFALGP
jgi:hypothetical protein